MIERLQVFLGWYLAPWRKIGRKEFAIALLIATLPGLVFMVVGFTDSAGHFLGPLMDLGNMGQNMDPAALQRQLEDLQAGMSAGAAPEAFAVDWSGAFNNILLLALVPLSRMRLRDMGWFGWPEVALTVVFNLSVAASFVESVSGWNPLPLAGLFGVLNFGGYMWVSMAKGKPTTAVHERTDYTLPSTQDPTRMDRDDDRY